MGELNQRRGGVPSSLLEPQQSTDREDLLSAWLLSRDIGLLPTDWDSHHLGSRLQALGLRLDHTTGLLGLQSQRQV